ARRDTRPRRRRSRGRRRRSARAAPVVVAHRRLRRLRRRLASLDPDLAELLVLADGDASALEEFQHAKEDADRVRLGLPLREELAERRLPPRLEDALEPQDVLLERRVVLRDDVAADLRLAQQARERGEEAVGARLLDR